MNNSNLLKRLPVCCLLCLLSLLAACAPTPDNEQLKVAIQTSLSREALPPALDLEHLEVPMRAPGKAQVVLWTKQQELQRNYTLEYLRESRAFAVKSYTTVRRGADGTYHRVPNDSRAVPTELASRFDFSDDFEQKYLLLYAGEGKSLASMRKAFEGERLTFLTSKQLASFEVCDLGGDALILLVPRYRGLSVWVNEIEHHGDMLKQGPQVARFKGGLPVYIYGSFSDKLPKHEIHVSFDELGEYFLTREALLTQLKTAAGKEN